MHTKFYILVLAFVFITVKGRLVHKNKTKTLDGYQTEHPDPTIRLTRSSENDLLMGLSKEESVNDVYLQFFNKITSNVLPSNPKRKDQREAAKFLRTERESDDNDRKNNSKINRYSFNTHTKHKPLLVKKPIPKFTDIDYDNDFLTKMNKARTVFGDSEDHEDQDFNLDDYDFDINHDEFISGSKPLEPRLSIKNFESIVAPEIQMPDKIAEKNDHQPSKRAGPTAMNSKEISEYYDDVTTTKVSVKEAISQESENDYSDEADYIKQGSRNITAVRSIRSWDLGVHNNKHGDITFKLKPKFFSVLPMFPQVPSNKKSK